MATVATMNLDRALKIDGWMAQQELEWLALQASHHRCIVELGSYLGRSTRAMCDNTRGLVVAIDDFHGPREIAMTERHTIYDRFLANMAGCDNLMVIRADHATAKLLPGLDADMIFIDGSHEYADVKRDILKWMPQVAPGGLLCGHDARSAPVIRAVRELLDGAWTVPGTLIWVKNL